MNASADDQETADTVKVILVAGLVVQLVVFGLFIVVTAIFHHRITARPTTRSECINVPWKTYIVVLYVVSALIMVRSIFRTVEYLEGREGELQSNEIYFYVLDTMLMFFVPVIFNWYHPSTIIPQQSGKEGYPRAGSDELQEIV